MANENEVASSMEVAENDQIALSEETSELENFSDKTNQVESQVVEPYPREIQTNDSDKLAHQEKLLKQFLNLIFGLIMSVVVQYSYLWLLKRNEGKGEKLTIAFKVSNELERQKMVSEAIRYSKKGYEVYFGVCTSYKKPNKYERVKGEEVTLQLGVWVDIDTQGGTHIGDQYPPDLETAISFLPLKPSIVVNSGYGVHCYYLFDKPLVITDERRNEAVERNKKFLAIIRKNAGKYGGAVDHVEDLPRILRLPRTRNYKLGVSDDAPMCEVVEINDIRYSVEQIDEIIAEHYQEESKATVISLEEHKKDRVKSVTTIVDDNTKNVTVTQLIMIINNSPEKFFERDQHNGFICPICGSGSGPNGTGMTQWPQNPKHLHCWHCGKGQDVIAWLIDSKGYTFRQFLRYAASILGLTIVDDENIRLADVLGLKRYENERIIPCVTNYDTILKEDPSLQGLIGIDHFSIKMIKLRTPPWGTKEDIGKAWTDTDDSQLRHYIYLNYEDVKLTKVFNDCLSVIIESNSLHPVRNYLQHLPEWDGVERAATFFIDILGVENDEYSRTITFFWLKAAIKRVLHPGCKFDYCLVLAGSQGIGKTTALERLGVNWFNNSIDNINNKDAIEGLMGSWIIEMGELQATKKADNEAIKAYLSRTTDKVRLPYARRTEEYPRQCVFAATTNDSEPLKDKTGGRRFWILKSTAKSDTTPDRLSILDDEYIEQVWAEVYKKYNDEASTGEVKLLPPPHILQRATELQNEFTEGSEIKAMIENYLEQLIPKNDVWKKMSKYQRRNFIQGVHVTLDGEEVVGECHRNKVCSSEILFELLNIENPLKERSTVREINAILDNMNGWHKNSDSGKRMGAYGSQKNYYIRNSII